MSTALPDALAAARADETRRAARALLRRPVIRATGAGSDAFPLIRKHSDALRAWFGQHAGWRLAVDSEVARLVKRAPARVDATRPARDTRSHAAFGRRRYVLVCLALAALERADAQITLGRLAEQIVLAAADPQLADAGITFTLEDRDERSDLVAVVRLLLELGVLSRVAGDEDAYVRSTGDVLYDVARRVLAGLIAAPRGPSTITAAAFEQRLEQLGEQSRMDSDDARNEAIRHELTRRLLDDPVLYYDELDEAHLTYLQRQRAAVTRRISEFTGLVAEVRAEGIAMIDPSDDLTDVRMPEQGTEGHLTLLLAGQLAGRAEPVGLAELHSRTRQLAAEHKAYWRKDATQPGAEVDLTAQALHRLEALHLIRITDDGVLARPALARYRITEPTVREPSR